MTPKQFQKYLDRDQGRCYHCGTTEALIPHHRSNRGMGGSKLRDVPSNIITICFEFNYLMESDPFQARTAVEKGWKLRAGQDPLRVPVWDAVDGLGYLLQDNFERVADANS